LDAPLITISFHFPEFLSSILITFSFQHLPMKPVPEYSTVRPGLFHWQGYEPEVKCDCSSTAIVTHSGLIFIDPVPLADAPLKDLVAESFSAPAAVVLTSGNHQRESLALAKRFGITVFAPADAWDDIIADQRFRPGDPVAGMESIALPGFGPGETVFLHEGALIFGDALINLEPEGLRLLPEKYRVDSKQALRSLEALRLLNPELLLFAHGNPITSNSAARLVASIS
jgi:glyoxylase-like metal-dependent hydrolase (beta-lactamase superfamily II)